MCKYSPCVGSLLLSFTLFSLSPSAAPAVFWHITAPPPTCRGLPRARKKKRNKFNNQYPPVVTTDTIRARTLSPSEGAPDPGCVVTHTQAFFGGEQRSGSKIRKTLTAACGGGSGSSSGAASDELTSVSSSCLTPPSPFVDAHDVLSCSGSSSTGAAVKPTRKGLKPFGRPRPPPLWTHGDDRRAFFEGLPPEWAGVRREGGYGCVPAVLAATAVLLFVCGLRERWAADVGHDARLRGVQDYTHAVRGWEETHRTRLSSLPPALAVRGLHVGAGDAAPALRLPLSHIDGVAAAAEPLPRRFPPAAPAVFPLPGSATALAATLSRHAPYLLHHHGDLSVAGGGSGEEEEDVPLHSVGWPEGGAAEGGSTGDELWIADAEGSLRIPILERVSFFHEETRETDTWQHCAYGAEGGSYAEDEAGRVQCTVYYRLTSLCVLVDHVPRWGWVFKGGCNSGGSVAGYAHVAGPRRRSSEKGQGVTVDLTDPSFAVTVRHVKDPQMLVDSYGPALRDPHQAGSAHLCMAGLLVALLAMAEMMKCVSDTSEAPFKKGCGARWARWAGGSCPRGTSTPDAANANSSVAIDVSA